jgi:hypothetical protein
MYRLPLTILLFILSSVLTYGQKTIVGKILSTTTKEPIPYANIGIVNSNVGTISNYDGSFSILLPQRLSNDTLTFSSLGFFGKKMPVNMLESKKEYTILLSEKATLLKPVIITAKMAKDKYFELGNKTYDSGNYEPDTTYAGRSVALLIDNKNFPKGISFPVYIKKAKLCIFTNNFDSYKFRIRLNKYDSLTGKPGEDLLDKSIVVESSLKNGWLDFDLSKLYFSVSGPFFVTFEQLLDLEDRTVIALGYRRIIRMHPDWLKTETVIFDGKKETTQKLIMGGIDLPGTFIGASYSKSVIEKYSCFIRETSLGGWTKVPLIIAATVTVCGQAATTTEISSKLPVLEIHKSMKLKTNNHY